VTLFVLVGCVVVYTDGFGRCSLPVCLDNRQSTMLCSALLRLPHDIRFIQMFLYCHQKKSFLFSGEKRGCVPPQISQARGSRWYVSACTTQSHRRHTRTCTYNHCTR
jgi:hypothetical protein